MPTLEEIAEISGVSRSTVSRVINNDPHVSETTREKVMAVVKELNYQPNAAARSLAAGRTHILGLVIPSGVSALFSDPYFPILIQGVSATCSAKEYSVMLWLAEAEFERRTIRQVLHNGLLDGVIVSSMQIGDPIVARLRESNLPFVLIGRHPTADEVSYVDVDNDGAAQAAVTHLLRLGRKRIATITGPQNAAVGQERRKGYSKALRARGITVIPELIVEGDFTEDGGALAMQQLLPHHPDAVFAASDVMAVGALRVLHAAGLRVPEDVALVGFDDVPLAARQTPPLTTIRQPIRQMGAMAVETLLTLLEDPEHGAHHILLPTQLVIRDSCGTNLS